MSTQDIANLSAKEHLRLLDELWDSLSAIPLTNPQREELDRDGSAGISWEEVRRRTP
jgi:putative addiction module component (TIGR02574 family)